MKSSFLCLFIVKFSTIRAGVDESSSKFIPDFMNFVCKQWCQWLIDTRHQVPFHQLAFECTTEKRNLNLILTILNNFEMCVHYYCASMCTVEQLWKGNHMSHSMVVRCEILHFNGFSGMHTNFHILRTHIHVKKNLRSFKDSFGWLRFFSSKTNDNKLPNNDAWINMQCVRTGT